jgi:hypothetical protein
LFIEDDQTRHLQSRQTQAVVGHGMTEFDAACAIACGRTEEVERLPDVASLSAARSG